MGVVEEYEEKFGNKNDVAIDQKEIDKFIKSDSFNEEQFSSSISVEEYEKLRKKEEEDFIEANIDYMVDIPHDMKLSDIEPNQNFNEPTNNENNFVINVEEDSKIDAISSTDNTIEEIEEIVEDIDNKEIINSKDIYLDEEKLKEMEQNLNLAISGTEDNIAIDEDNVQEELLVKKSLDEYEKEKRKIAIANMGNKYGLTEIEVKEKIQKYVDFTKELRELEKKEADLGFIKSAIEEKKRRDEDDKLTKGISQILANVQNEIQNDNFLETVDKNSIYKNIFLTHIKTGILEYINHSESSIEKESTEKKELFNIFAKKYNLRVCEINKNAYTSMFLNENSLNSYISLMSYIFNNDLIRNELKVLIKEIDKIDLSLDKIYYI